MMNKKKFPKKFLVLLSLEMPLFIMVMLTMKNLFLKETDLGQVSTILSAATLKQPKR